MLAQRKLKHGCDWIDGGMQLLSVFIKKETGMKITNQSESEEAIEKVAQHSTLDANTFAFLDQCNNYQIKLVKLPHKLFNGIFGVWIFC